MLPMRYRTAKQAYSLIEDILQVLCSVATFATFLRVIEEHALSKIFLLLPLLLIGHFVIRKNDALRQDVHTMAMLGGAATGINSGFLSSIVSDTPQKHSLITNPMQNEINPDSVYLVRSLILRHVELLHFPVIIGSVFYSYCLVFDRLPSRQNTQLAASTALCGAIMITMTTSVMSENQNPANQTTLEPVKLFMCMFLLAFLVGMLPMVRPYQRPWMLCVLAFIVNIFWQCHHLDTLVWNWETCHYPIPGCITGVTLIFLINIHESGYAPTGEEDTLTNEEEALFLASKDKPVPANNNSIKPRDIIDAREVLFNSYLWHTITYIIERISLAFIRASQKKREVNVYYEPHGSDVWISCLTMSAFLGVTSPYFKSDIHTRLGVIVMGLLYYVTMTLSGGVLCNGYFIDMIFGMTIVFFCHNRYHILY